MRRPKIKVWLVKRGKFEAEHSHDGKLREAAHAHTFVYDVKLYGPVNEEGFLVDFRKLESDMQTLVSKKLSGKNLNAVIKTPTTENIAVWIFNQMKPVYGKLLRAVTVYESPNSYIIYEGEKPSYFLS